MTTPSTDELPRLGRYQVLNKLAQGGMAEIFLAKAIGVMGFERLVAIKLIHSQLTRDAEFVKMFIDEARIAMHLQHRNIVQVFDLDRAGDTYFIAMEYVHGCNLYDVYERIAQKGRWVDLPLALYIVAEVSKGLHFAHTRTGADGRPLGIIHRDISPQNVLLSFEGEVKITDFGIAKAAERLHVTTPGIVKGKYAYMAPEILKEKGVDGRADVFAAGVLLYELLVGENPFAGATPVQTIENVLQKVVPTPSQRGAMVSRELDQIAMTALAKDPNERFRSAAELAEALTEHGLNLTTARRDIASGDATVSALLHELFPEKARRTQQAAAPGSFALPLVSNPEPAVRDTYREDPSSAPDTGLGERKTDPERTDEGDSTILNLEPARPAISRGGGLYSADSEPSTALDLEKFDRSQRDRTDPVRLDFEPVTDKSLSALDEPDVTSSPKIIGPTGDYGDEDTLLNREASRAAAIPLPRIEDVAQTRPPAVSVSYPLVSPVPPQHMSGPTAPAGPAGPLHGQVYPAHPHMVAFPAAQPAPQPSRALLWIGMVLVALAIVALGSVVMLRRGTESIWVPIVSDPAGARVIINGEEQADRTPIQASLPVGQTHRIELRMPGHRTYQRDFLPLEGVEGRVDAKLEAITGSILFKVDPRDATLSVNGVSRGKVPDRLDGLLVGQDLVIRIERDGYLPHQVSTALTEQDPIVTINATLERRRP